MMLRTYILFIAVKVPLSASRMYYPNTALISSRNHANVLRYRCQPTPTARVRARLERLASGDLDVDEQDHPTTDEPMTSGLLLARYGLVALTFHYVVFFLTWAALFVFVGNTDSEQMPSFLWTVLDQEQFDSITKSVSGRLGTSFAILELIGPARLALDIISTPPLARWARQYSAFRDFEGGVSSQWLRLKSMATQEPYSKHDR